jgi:hypothetical protein
LPVVVQAQFTFTTNADNTITIEGYTGSGGSVTIPGSTNGLLVTSIGEWAFYATSVTNVLVPDSVTHIADGAFFDCAALANVTIGTSNASIGDWTFAFCPNLSSVCFRGNAPSLGGVDVFYGNAATVYYLLGAAGWGPMLGGHLAVLWNPPVPYDYSTNSGTITITGYTGSGGAVVIPGTINFLPVTRIGDLAFSSTSLTSVTILNSVSNIGRYAFSSCTSLINLTIGNSVTSIEEGAFEFCTSLTSIPIPNGVTSIGLSAFGYCTSLTEITVDALNSVYSSVGGVLFDKSQTTLVEYPGGKGGSYTIPNSVTSIGGAVSRLHENVPM